MLLKLRSETESCRNVMWSLANGQAETWYSCLVLYAEFGLKSYSVIHQLWFFASARL